MDGRPNVVLFVFDTLRADALSCYENAFSVSTPAMDSVADRGTLFEQAYAVGPWTPPAHGAMFSGQYPSQTGFHGAWPTMPESVPLLAEWFSDHGYRTYGIPGPAKMGSETGLDRGFDEYYEVYEEVAERPSPAYLRQLVTDPLIRRDFTRLARRGNDYYTEIKFDRLRDWLGSTAEPFFAMANVTTVHAPYDPPRPYKREATPALHRRLPLLEELLDDPGSYHDEQVDEERLFAAADGRDAKSIAMRHFDGVDALSDAELDVLRAWYAASLRYLDDRLGAFLNWLERSGLREETLIVLTSDHGEFFGEHDLLYHGNFLYDEVMRVPLMMAGPGVPENERRTDLVSHVDLFDTLCDLCGLRPPTETEGVSTFGPERRDAVFTAEAVSDEGDRAAADEVSRRTRSAFEAGRKSIRTETHRFERWSDGTERLYDLPGEEVVDDPDPEIVADLGERLVAELGEEFDVPDDVPDDEFSAGVERNLRELGYLE